MSIPYQEERFEYKGFPCVVLFMPTCYRCGYVGIPKDLEINPDEIDCHCGITYTSDELYHNEDKDVLWIGFDCGHCCDGFDVEKGKEYFSDNESTMRQIEVMEQTGYFAVCNKDNPVRDLEYVKSECMKIVWQILEIQNK